MIYPNCMVNSKKLTFASDKSKTSRSRTIIALIGVAGIALSVLAHAGAVAVPNGDFSVPGNAGSVGGGPIGGSGTNVGIGASLGPWTGTFNGAVALLAPPTLTIDSTARTANINGVLGVNVAGLFNNGGYFSQTLPTPYVPNKRNTVGVDINSGGSLGLGTLATTNVGIALRSGATVLGSSTTAPAQLVSLAPVNGTTYHLTLIYDTGPTVSGNVDIQLFDLPQNQLTANLMPTVTFSNVTLNVGAITDPTTQLHVSGLGSQSAQVGTPFGAPLIAKVTDMLGTPMEGVIVTVAAPPTGASAVLTSGSSSGTSVQAVTDTSGLVTVSATANSIAGCYRVTASVGGVPSQAIFSLRNWSTAQIFRFLDAGVDMTALQQDSIYCDGFD
ncbi:hypothetical protein [Dokdonella soli]|uniref:Big-1 domain-containing protein n=1 Tax=Dokdonella soli TaxID=529810 RepID=A0ABP3TK11_9GAMM